MTQLELIPAHVAPKRQRPDKPTRAPNPAATEDWARRAVQWQAEHPEVVREYHEQLDALAIVATRNGDKRIAPRGAWEFVRSGFKVTMPNAFQATFTAQWQASRPHWAHLIRNGRA